jgi:predicted DNA binding CopG/RHH family protein
MKSSKKVNKKRKDPLSGDLSDMLENGHWEKVKFELRPKNKVITLRLSEDLLELVKLEAKKCGLDYQKFIRLSLERVLLKTS